MSTTVVLNAAGLNLQPNQISLPDGSLSEASNVIIRRDNVIEPRRGFRLDGDTAGSANDRIKQLFVYKERILRHFASSLQFEDGTNNDGTRKFTDFSGSFSETESGLRIKSAESNGNFYFTTSEGIKKISSSTGDGLSSATITQAGGVKAIDLTARLNVELGNETGFLPQDSAVAYRTVWGINDANNNLILGAPSQREEIYSPLTSLLLRDFGRTLGALDDINQSGSIINDGNYVSSLILPSTSTAVEIQTNTIALASKIDNDILYANTGGAPLTIGSAAISGGVCTVTFSAGTATDYFVIGSRIYLANFSPASGTLNGAQTVTGVTSSTITFTTTATGAVTVTSSTIVSYEYRYIVNNGTVDFPTSLVSLVVDTPSTNNELINIQDSLQRIITRLQSEPIAVISSSLSTLFILPLDITTTATVQLDITIPAEITTNYFIQVYRSAISQATGTTVLQDLTPSDEMQLVYEAFPTSAEIAARFLTFEDITPDEFRGANLYTNQATGETALQANDIPPWAKDINSFKNYIFFTNTKTRHQKLLSLLGVSNMITDYDAGTTPKVVTTNGDKSNTYSFVTGVAEVSRITAVADSSNSLNGKYFLINSANNINKYYVWYKTSGASASDPAVSGRTGIRVEIATGETAANVALKTKNAIARYIFDFTTTNPSSTVIQITNVDFGYTDDIAVGTSTFTSPTVTVQGRGEKCTQETTSITVVAGSAYVGSGTSDYFTLNTAFNKQLYYIWFKKGTSTDPALSGKTGIQITVTNSTTATQVATAIKAALPSSYFTTSGTGATFTVTNVMYGPATNATEVVSDSGFTVSVTQEGALEVLLSDVVSPAIAVDATARSFVRVVNRNALESIYFYYLSSSTSVPGKMLIESRILSDTPFYLLGNNSDTGTAFNPDISPNLTISSITAGDVNNNLITTTSNHNMITGDKVIIDASETVPIVDGLYTITYVSDTTFRINTTIVTGDSSLPVGVANRAIDTEVSENKVAPNRVYYSKVNQPESVPVANFFDVGASNKNILRIFPLRDSLFVFKEEGLYRVSGESAPFSLSLFDSSFNLLAPDSLVVCNNYLYGWTTQGISKVSEGGAEPSISRPIDVNILKLSTPQYSNFSTATFGIGYESDNSYLVWTVAEPTDDVATICYRYSTLTNSWTTYDKTNTCGIVHPNENKLYLGAGDINQMEQERKDFTRYDYADREYSTSLTANNYLNNILKVASTINIDIGDVIVQEQFLTVYEYNMLLKKLDIDPSIADSNYYSSLQAVGGDDLRQKLVALANKLDADTGVSDTDYFNSIDTKSGTITSITVANPTIITTSSSHGLLTNRYIIINGSDSSPNINGNFSITKLSSNTFSIDQAVAEAGTTGSFTTQVNDINDIKACYNIIIDKLNADSQVSFSNYPQSNFTTTQEAIVTAIDTNTKEVTLNLKLDYVVGTLTIFKSIPTSFTYSPQTMQDPIGLKHLREATVMFENKAFTTAILSFSTDLLPLFNDITFAGDGNGIFGYKIFGKGFFGGASNSAPFRTYIPRNNQRCRFIRVRFQHSIARESYAIFGISLTGEISQSSRAYR